MTPNPPIEENLKRVAAALVADALAVSPRWRAGAVRYPGTTSSALVEQTAADHPHASVQIGGMIVTAWQLPTRAIRLAVSNNGVALTARVEDKDSLDTLKRWAASRLSSEMRH